VRNPLRSEDAMFRFLLWTLAVAVAIVVVVYLVRAVT
jgi:hypothetical protein